MNEQKLSEGKSPKRKLAPVPLVPDLAEFVRRIVEAAIGFQDAAPGFLDNNGQIGHRSTRDEVSNAAMGLVGLNAIDYVRSVVGGPIEAEDRAKLTASPIKSRDAGDQVKDDVVYYLVRRAIALLLTIRSPEAGKQRPFGNRKLIRPYLKRIDQLPATPEQGWKQWANLISEMTLAGAGVGLWIDSADWAGLSAEPPSGNIYAAAEARAVRNRQAKARRIFKKRLGLPPAAFLKLSFPEQQNTKVRQGRGAGEPLSEGQASRAHLRAKRIEGMKPTQVELRSALSELIEQRLPTIWRPKA